MYKIAICEDDKDYIEVLKKLILSTNIVDTNMLQFHDFISGEQLVYEQKIDFDLVIMDIQLAKMDGYDTAMKLRKIDNNFLLVFCSGVIMPTPKFFKANAFRYLDKGDSYEVILDDMTAVMKEMVVRKNRPYVMCKYGRGKDQVRVYAESVLYVGNYGYKECTIFPYGKLKDMYPTETLRVNKNLNSVAEVFNEDNNFVRLHNSYLVNMEYIMKVAAESVELIDGTILNVSRSKTKYFREKFAKYASSKYEG